jgi:hyperosmotically inducible protein
MMNSNSTPKIVVGIGLAAVFGAGVSIFAVRAKQESEIARTTPPAAVAAQNDQSAADTTAPVQGAPAQAPADQSIPAPTTQGSAPTTAVMPAPTPAATALGDQSDADKSKPSKSKTPDRAERRAARTPSSVDMSVSRVASSNKGASDSSDSVTNSQQAAVVAPSGDATSTTDATNEAATAAASSAPAGATADTQSAPAQTGQQAAPASDSQITADVKTEIATASPDSNVIVTTNNGVVALAGSAPSQTEAEQAKQAAQRVAGIGHVDASGLTVINR